MKSQTMLRMMLVAATLAAATAVAAPKGLNADEATSLLKGNSVEGTNKWKKTYHWYFDEYGELRMRDNLGNRGRAKWHIDKKGQFCFQDKRMKEENCAPIVPLGEGRYDVPLDSQLKWNKVSPGNSYGL
jgi:hypothetical protein